MIEGGIRKVFDVPLFSHDINRSEAMKHISRFASMDQASLLRLAKEMVHIFSDRLDVRELPKLSTHLNKDKSGSNKRLEDVLAQKKEPEKAREVFGPISGALMKAAHFCNKESS